MIISRFHAITPPLADQRDGVAKRVVLAARTAQWRAIDAATWDQIAQGDLASLAPGVLEDLREIQLLVPDDEDELAAILQQNQAAIDHDDALGIAVQPTALCQMGCDYCGQTHENRKLSADDQDRLLRRARALLATGRYHVFRVSWFGGEPLLGLSVMRTLAPRFRALAEEFHCEFQSGITTNGLDLDDAVAAELVHSLGVREFLITLDGPAELHDARRPAKGGGGTFARIFAHVASLARREDLAAAVTIRCNVDRRNVDGVSRLIQMLADAGVLDRLRDFFVAPVHDWGNDAGSLALSPTEFAERETVWLAELAARGFNSPKLIPRRETIRCVAVTQHSFLVDPYGQLFNCTEASLVAAPPPAAVAAAVGRQLPLLSTSAAYAIGDLSGGEQPERRQILGDFNARVSRGEYPCATCRMLPVCGGACPKQWLEGNVPCPSAKYNIEARLLLGYALARLDAEPRAL